MAPKPTLMFVPSGASPIEVTVAPSRSSTRRREAAHGAVRRVARDPQAGERNAEAARHEVGVALPRAVVALSLGAAGRDGLVEERLDLELLGVGELAPVALEELDPVVLGRVVRGGDDRAAALGEQRDRRRRQHPGEPDERSSGRKPLGERRLERRAGAARVAADEHGRAGRPDRERMPEPANEIVGEVPPGDSAHAVGSEIAAGPGHGGRASVSACEYWGALRALRRPAFLRSTMRESRFR